MTRLTRLLAEVRVVARYSRNGTKIAIGVLVVAVVAGASFLALARTGAHTGAPAAAAPGASGVHGSTGTRSGGSAGTAGGVAAAAVTCTQLQAQLRVYDARFPDRSKAGAGDVAAVRSLVAQAGTACPTVQRTFVTNVLAHDWPGISPAASQATAAPAASAKSSHH